MYVCLCMGVTDTQVREKIEEGCVSTDALQDTLGVGKNCGQCMEMVQQILEKERSLSPVHSLKKPISSCKDSRKSGEETPFTR